MNIGNYIRSGLCYLDEQFIEATGRAFTDAERGTRLTAIYQLPMNTAGPRLFGIDEPDEMEVELGWNTTKKKLGDIPEVASKFIDLTGGMWVVINRHRRDDKVRGQNRLVLTVCRYQETFVSSPEHGKQGEWTLHKQ